MAGPLPQTTEAIDHTPLESPQNGPSQVNWFPTFRNRISRSAMRGGQKSHHLCTFGDTAVDLVGPTNMNFGVDFMTTDLMVWVPLTSHTVVCAPLPPPPPPGRPWYGSARAARGGT